MFRYLYFLFSILYLMLTTMVGSAVAGEFRRVDSVVFVDSCLTSTPLGHIEGFS